MCLKKTDYEGRLILPYFSFFVLIMCGNLFELVLTYLIFSLIHLGTSSLLQFRIWYRRAPVMTQASSRLFVFPLQFPAEAIWHIGPAPFYRPASLNLTLTAWTVCGRSLCLRDRESRSVDKSYCLESPNLVLVTPVRPQSQSRNALTNMRFWRMLTYLLKNGVFRLSHESIYIIYL